MAGDLRRLAALVHLGLDGEAVVGPEGYAIRETELDADGRAIGYRLYDAEHNAVDNAA